MYNVCSVPWRDIMMHVGRYLEYRDVQYRGDIMINVGDIFSTMGCSVLWGIS